MLWLFGAPWLVFCGWWGVRALQADKVVRVAQRSRSALVVVVVVCYWAARQWPERLWQPSLILDCVGLTLEIAGVAFAIWAREHLGRVWSSRVTLTENHHIVKTGPYRWVRHPIYTGILTGMAGAALWLGHLPALLFVLGLAVDYWSKILAEERLLMEHFGDEYRDYRRETRALIPFIL